MPIFPDLDGELSAASIGSRIRAQRKQCGWTLNDFAGRLSISLGTLSAIENGKSTLNVDLFLTIARVLRVPLDALLPPIDPQHYLVTRRSSIDATPSWPVKLVDPIAEKLISYHNRLWPLAQPFFGRHLEPMVINVESITDDQLQFISHHDEEFVFVLHGGIECLIQTPDGLRTEQLKAGECIYFASSLPHCIRSTCEESAQCVHVLHSKHEPCDSALATRTSGRGVYLIDASRKTLVHQISNRIKSLRQANGVSLREFARLVGITERRVKAIERGDRSVSLQLLSQICRVFQKPREYFLPGGFVEQPYCSALRKTQIRREPARDTRVDPILANTFPGATFKTLGTGFSGRGMEPFHIVLRSVRQVHGELHSRRGQEFIYVLDGAIRLRLERDGKEEVLFPGDSCFVDSVVPHYFIGARVYPFDKRPAEVLAVFWQPRGDGESRSRSDSSERPS